MTSTLREINTLVAGYTEERIWLLLSVQSPALTKALCLLLPPTVRFVLFVLQVEAKYVFSNSFNLNSKMSENVELQNVFDLL